MFKLTTVTLVLAGLTLGACSQTNQNQGIGTVAGGAIGAILGSQIGSGSGRDFAIAGGAILGALAGSEIGRQLDERDRLLMAQAQQQATTAPLGSAIAWNNDRSGHRGTVTAVDDGRTTDGRYCRRFEQDIYVDGRQQTETGIACQRADGTWETMN